MMIKDSRDLEMRADDVDVTGHAIDVCGSRSSGKVC